MPHKILKGFIHNQGKKLMHTAYCVPQHAVAIATVSLPAGRQVFLTPNTNTLIEIYSTISDQTGIHDQKDSQVDDKR